MDLRAGWDYFAPAPGTEDKMFCRVCGDEMDCKRNVKGATSFVEAMGGTGHLHDSFTCKNSGQPWHNQVLKLKLEARSTSSTKLSRMFLEEAEEIKLSRLHTKDV